MSPPDAAPEGSSPEEPVARLVRGLRALERAYSPGHHGRWSARRRSRLVDEAVRGLARELGAAGGPVSLVALGGYGREVLCPGSDVDLMVLHAERRSDRVRRAAETVFYPFWDAGIPLGHAVRTVGECLAGARERLDTACALLDGRPVWGDPGPWTELHRSLARELSRDRAGFLGRLIEDAAGRHDRYPACTTHLEPDLKEGAGGLRDLHAIDWAGAPLGAGREGLRDAGLLRTAEIGALEEAEEFLVRLRSALHLETGKRTDRVVLEYQPALAEAFGFRATAGLGATDALMQALFEHARQVDHLREVFLDRTLAAERGATATLEHPAPSTPDDVMETFARAASAGASLPPTALDAVEHADLGAAPYGWTERTRRAFAEILAAGDPGGRALEAMDRAGLLTRFLPEWAAVRCRPQRDPYHRFTVDVHLLRTAAAAAGLLHGEVGNDPVVAAAVAAVTDRDPVLLGALLHDIGKTGEGRHVETGLRVAASVLERMGVPAPSRERVLFLVGEHLLLSDTATRRDLTDENLVLDVAARVGDPERLATLYVLTVADAEATGPHAHTPWRMALLRELVGKVERVLERGEMGPDRAEVLEEAIEEVRALLRTEDPARVDRYLDRLPRPYLLAIPPEEAARHFRLLSPRIGATDVRTEARAGARPETYELAVVAADRPGLLARIAGALSLAGLNILSAQAFTTEDGVALDLFVVETAFHGEADEERWRAFRSHLRRALEGRISLEYRVREKRRHYPPPHPEVPLEVTVRNDVSDFFTVVEVSAADRIGLLFDLARAFEDLALDVHLAKVATYGARVVDAFYVRDLYGGKVEDAEHVREIERAVAVRLA